MVEVAKKFRRKERTPQRVAEDLEPDYRDEGQERIRRMKEMAERLFQDEIKPQRQPMPPVKHKGLIMAFSFTAMLIVSVIVVHRVNRFINLEEQVLSSEGRVQSSLQRRVNLFNNIVNAALNQATLESELVKHVADSRADIVPSPSAPEAGPLASSEFNLDSLSSGMEGSEMIKNLQASFGSDLPLSKLLALVEQYPDIKFLNIYSQLINNLVEIENHLIERRDRHNHHIMIYNTAISQFPWYLIARLAGFDRHAYYQVENEAYEHVPALESKIFNRLLPVETNK
ncbi:MAG: LemA family protein [SAR324 cluster bacterium]|nr:LemA family protein [SAR324 cluster bacterium]